MHGTPFTPDAGPRVVDVRFTADSISAELSDARTISAPLSWYPRLLDATAEVRDRWQLAGGGRGIHWPALDEDLSVDGLLSGAPAPGVRG